MVTRNPGGSSTYPLIKMNRTNKSGNKFYKNILLERMREILKKLTQLQVQGQVQKSPLCYKYSETFSP